jgi:hypothetical protein
MKINEIVKPQPQLDEGIANILKTLGKKVAPNAIATSSGKIGQAVDYLKGGLKASGKGILDGLETAGLFFLVKPIWDYNTIMNNAEEQLNAGKITRENYNEMHDAYLGEAIMQMTAGLVGAGVLRSIPALTGFLRYIPVIGPAIAGGIAMLSAAGSVYFLEKVSSKEGREMIANFCTAGILKDTGAIGNAAVDYFAKIFKEAVGMKDDGEPDTKPTDNTTPADTKPTDAKPADNTTPTDAKPADNTTPADSKPTTSPNAEPAQDPNVYTPSNMRRDANGNLLLKYG